MKGKNVFSGLKRGLGKMMGAFSSLGTSLMDMATGTKRDAKGVLRSTGGRGITGGLDKQDDLHLVLQEVSALLQRVL